MSVFETGMLRGAALAEQGAVDEAIARIREGVTKWTRGSDALQKNGESDRLTRTRHGLFRRKIMVGRNAWAPPCGARTRAGGNCLARVEPISKSFEEDDEASGLHEAKEVLRIELPADKDAALPLNPGEEPFDQPAPGISPKSASILRRARAAIGAVRRDHLDAVFA